MVASLTESLLRNEKNRFLLPLPTMQDGNLMAEKDADKAALFADLLANQRVPPAYLVAYEWVLTHLGGIARN
jgi:hypothetical protein